MHRTDKYSEHNSIVTASLAKWLSVRLRTKWFSVRVQLQSLELTIYAILCRNVNILALWFYQQELASLFQKQEKLKVSRSTYSIADDGHVKIERLHVVVSPNMIFCAFELMSIYWNTFTRSSIQVSKFFLTLDK